MQPYNKSLLKIILGKLDHERLLTAARDKDEAPDVREVAQKILDESMKAPSIPQIIKALFPLPIFWQALPLLIVKFSPPEFKMDKLTAEQKHNVEYQITDEAKQLHSPQLLKYLDELGLSCKELDVFDRLFQCHHQPIERQIADALGQSVEFRKPVSPQPVVMYFAEMLEAFCLGDESKANDLLKLASDKIPSSDYEDESLFNSDILPVFAATFLVTNIKEIDRKKCESLLYKAYVHNLLFLFQALLNRKDICEWINEVTVQNSWRRDTVVQAILADDKATPFHEMLANSLACLKPLEDYANYLFWCCKNADRPAAQVILQSQFIDELVKGKNTEGNSIAHSFAQANECSESELNVLKLLITNYPQLLNQKGMEGRTPLFTAVKNYNTDAALFFLEQKNINLTAKTDKNENVLHAAIQALAATAHSRHSDEHGHANKIFSALIHHPQIAPLLTWHDHPGCHHENPVVYACDKGLLDVARRLQTKAQKLGDADLVLAASVDAPLYEMKGRKVSALEYEVNDRSTHSQKVLNLIALGAKHTFNEKDSQYLAFLMRELMLHNRVDVLAPLCEIAKQTGSAKVMSAVKESAEIALWPDVSPKRVSLFLNFMATFNSFEEKDLDRIQKYCDQLRLDPYVRKSDLEALENEINNRRGLLKTAGVTPKA